MAQAGKFYKVHGVPNLLKKSYPLKEVRAGTTVRCLGGAPKRSLDVIDVMLRTGEVRSVYSFQLETPIKLRRR